MMSLRRTIAIVAMVSVLVAAAASAAAHPLETVPPTHWAYSALRQLAALGLIPFRTLAALPLTRGEIADLVQSAEQAARTRLLPPGTNDLLVALRREFPPRDQPVRPQAAVRGATGTASPLTTYPGLAPGSYTGVGIGAGGTNGLAWVEGGLSSSGAQLVRAYGIAKFGEFKLQAGREIQQWGPSSRTSLILSEWAGGIDMLRLVIDSGRFRFVKFVSQKVTVPRAIYLVGTRLDWQATNRFRIGFSESMIMFSGRALAYALLNPLPVVLTEALDPTRLQNRWFRESVQFVDAVDFDWLIWPGFTLSGQLLIDDWSSTGKRPNRIGGLILFTWADPFANGRTSLHVEYSAVLNYTYTDNQLPLFSYILPSGRFLGYWLGNDADDLVLQVEYVLNPGATVSGWIARTRHGEGRVGVFQPMRFKNSFLSGVVENRVSVGAQYETHDADRTVRYWGEIASVQNQNNKAGRNVLDLLFGVELLWRW